MARLSHLSLYVIRFCAGATLLLAVVWVIIVVAAMWLTPHQADTTPMSKSADPNLAEPLSPAPEVKQAIYQPSDELIDAYVVSKNPYQLKGHSGILDTLHVSILGPTGVRARMRLPGGCLKFEKMIDEHTAIFEVIVAEGSITTDGELAVILLDSNPPDTSRPWRILVEGPLEGINGLGGVATVTALRFEGYYIPPPPEPVPPSEMSTADGTDENPASTPVPPIHNSPDNQCDYERQCTEAEFIGVMKSLERQWALTPEWLRIQCKADVTYPSIEDCIQKGTVMWLNIHPDEKVPWITSEIVTPAKGDH